MTPYTRIFLRTSCQIRSTYLPKRDHGVDMADQCLPTKQYLHLQSALQMLHFRIISMLNNSMTYIPHIYVSVSDKKPYIFHIYISIYIIIYIFICTTVICVYLDLHSFDISRNYKEIQGYRICSCPINKTLSCD